MSVKKIVIILIVLGVAGAAAFYLLAGERETDVYTTFAVTRGDIAQTVRETGTVRAPNEIKLGFLNSGKIKRVNYRTGDKVEKGAILAELDCGGLEMSEREASAALEVARGNLDKLMAGATNEDVAVARAGVQQAKAAYDAAKNELAKTKAAVEENIAQAEKNLNDLLLRTDNDITTYEQAVTTAETTLENTRAIYQKSIDNYNDSSLAAVNDKLAAANTALDTVYRTVNDDDGKDLLSVREPRYLTDTNSRYARALALYAAAAEALDAAKAGKTEDSVMAALNGALAALNEVFAALQSCYGALENSITSSSFTVTDLNALKTGISTQQTVIATAITAVQTAKQNLDNAILAYETNVSAADNALIQAKAAYDNAVISARHTLASARTAGAQAIASAEARSDNALEAWRVAQTQLDRITAPANQYDADLARAKTKQAQAALDSIRRQIENCLIESPIEGTVTKVNYEAGEQVMSGQTAVAMLGRNDFEIEALVSETDITKIRIENPAVITLDAYGDDVRFAGRIYFIEPAETVIQEVIYYKIKINFDPRGFDIKSGMTANAVITTARKEGVLAAPGRAVIEKNGKPDGGASAVTVPAEGVSRYVRVLAGGEVKEAPVTLGLRGDGGMVEVLSGVKEGDQVITYIKEK